MDEKRQALIDRIANGGEYEHFTLIVIEAPPKFLGFGRIGFQSTGPGDFMERSIAYAKSSLDFIMRDEHK